MGQLNHPVIMHINYFEQGQSIEYTVRRAVAMGFDGIEFRRARKVPGETPEAYVAELKRCAGQYGLRHILIGAPGIDAVNDDKAVVRAGIDAWKRFLDIAAEPLNLSVVNFMAGTLIRPDSDYNKFETIGSALAEPRHWEAAAEACREIAAYAPQIRFATETHHGYLHDLAPTARKLADMVNMPNFGINLDYGNAVGFADGTAPSLEDSIDICGDKLFYVHWKNSLPGKPRRIRCALSQGTINHRAYLRRLAASGYTGPIGMESPRPGDREWFAAEDLAYVRALMADVAAED